MTNASACMAIDFPEDLECAVCLDSWKQPRELMPCGHIYCLECLPMLSGDECAVCREGFQMIKVPNRTLVNMALNLKVECQLCGWTGKREASVQHTCLPEDQKKRAADTAPSAVMRSRMSSTRGRQRTASSGAAGSSAGLCVAVGGSTGPERTISIDSWGSGKPSDAPLDLNGRSDNNNNNISNVDVSSSSSSPPNTTGGRSHPLYYQPPQVKRGNGSGASVDTVSSSAGPPSSSYDTNSIMEYLFSPRGGNPSQQLRQHSPPLAGSGLVESAESSGPLATPTVGGLSSSTSAHPPPPSQQGTPQPPPARYADPHSHPPPPQRVGPSNAAAESPRINQTRTAHHCNADGGVPVTSSNTGPPPYAPQRGGSGGVGTPSLGYGVPGHGALSHGPPFHSPTQPPGRGGYGGGYAGVSPQHRTSAGGMMPHHRAQPSPVMNFRREQEQRMAVAGGGAPGLMHHTPYGKGFYYTPNESNHSGGRVAAPHPEPMYHHISDEELRQQQQQYHYYNQQHNRQGGRGTYEVIQPPASHPAPWTCYHLTQEEYDQIVSLFVFFDQDESGDLNRAELARLAKWLNYARTPQEVDRIFSVMDISGNEALSQAEFLTWLRYNKPDPQTLYGLTQSQYNTFMMQFQLYDGDQDGQLNEQDFTRMVLHAREVQTPREAARLFQSIDKHHVGSINLHAFLRFRAGYQG